MITKYKTLKTECEQLDTLLHDKRKTLIKHLEVKRINLHYRLESLLTYEYKLRPHIKAYMIRISNEITRINKQITLQDIL